MIGHRFGIIGDSVVRVDREIGHAHQMLAQRYDAVFCRRSSVWCDDDGEGAGVRFTDVHRVDPTWIFGDSDFLCIVLVDSEILSYCFLRSRISFEVVSQMRSQRQEMVRYGERLANG